MEILVLHSKLNTRSIWKEYTPYMLVFLTYCYLFLIITPYITYAYYLMHSQISPSEIGREGEGEREERKGEGGREGRERIHTDRQIGRAHV